MARTLGPGSWGTEDWAGPRGQHTLGTAPPALPTRTLVILCVLSGLLLLGLLGVAAIFAFRRSTARARAGKLARLNGVKVGSGVPILRS